MTTIGGGNSMVGGPPLPTNSGAPLSAGNHRDGLMRIDANHQAHHHHHHGALANQHQLINVVTEQQQQQRQQSEEATEPSNRGQAMTHIRTSSSGSVRGAFYQGDLPAPPGAYDNMMASPNQYPHQQPGGATQHSSHHYHHSHRPQLPQMIQRNQSGDSAKKKKSPRGASGHGQGHHPHHHGRGRHTRKTDGGGGVDNSPAKESFQSAATIASNTVVTSTTATTTTSMSSSSATSTRRQQQQPQTMADMAAMAISMDAGGSGHRSVFGGPGVASSQPPPPPPSHLQNHRGQQPPSIMRRGLATIGGSDVEGQRTRDWNAPIHGLYDHANASAGIGSHRHHANASPVLGHYRLAPIRDVVGGEDSRENSVENTPQSQSHRALDTYISHDSLQFSVTTDASVNSLGESYGRSNLASQNSRPPPRQNQQHYRGVHPPTQPSHHFNNVNAPPPPYNHAHSLGHGLTGTGAGSGSLGGASQQDDIAMFSNMVRNAANYGATSYSNPRNSNNDDREAVLATTPITPTSGSGGPAVLVSEPSTDMSDYSDPLASCDEEDEDDDEYDDEEYADETAFNSVRGLFLSLMDPTSWLARDAKLDDEGKLFFDDKDSWTLAGFVRLYLYNPVSPEFSSLQQFSWAVILGVAMGFYTAVWKWIIDMGIDVMWKTVPTKLYEMGFFTDLDGAFPIYHYMWLCPSIFGGILGYVFVILPIKIPDQNEWINNVHARGVQDYRTFFTLFALSTIGMWSGLSLGPELPLVLTAGMAGSWLGLTCRQSMLQARVMNLTAASAAVGGFFGFPMAGALFVLELPHRMGLQYFEALSPAAMASIVAVLSNRMITGDEVTGYFSYPFLTFTLPSQFFTNAIVYGLFGAAVGIAYARLTMKLKTFTHDLFHAPHDDEHHHHHQQQQPEAPQDKQQVIEDIANEHAPLVNEKVVSSAKGKHTNGSPIQQPSPGHRLLSFAIADEATRMGVVGTLAGAAVGLIGMFVPHVMFWGEAQLQNLIDKGLTPLPIFGEEGEVTADLGALGLCNGSDEDGFGLGCSALISIAKTVVIGLSLGTGIIGGHFWGPLFVGCSMSHFLTGFAQTITAKFGFWESLADYPCLIILCTMGSAHVVTFRAHTAIMLILTLTISAFDPGNDEDGNAKVAGDYSAVFPLLVVSVFISLMVSRDTVFYKTQRSRGDIMAVPEALCEPGMEGRPMVVDYDTPSSGDLEDFDGVVDDKHDSDDNNAVERPRQDNSHGGFREGNELTIDSIERAFQEKLRGGEAVEQVSDMSKKNASASASAMMSETSSNPPLDRLDEILSRPMETGRPQNLHRRWMSMPSAPDLKTSSAEKKMEKLPETPRFAGNRERSNSNSSSKGSLVQISSFGVIEDHQPELIEQARLWSSSAAESRHRRVPSLPTGRGHIRKVSVDSGMAVLAQASRTDRTAVNPTSGAGALSLEDIEQSFNAVLHQQPSRPAFSNGLVWTDSRV